MSTTAEVRSVQVDVLGISWGGGVAQHFAAFQRARCRRLVLVATATGALMVPARPSVLAHLVTPRRYLNRGYLERVPGEIYGGSARADPAHPAGQRLMYLLIPKSRLHVYQGGHLGLVTEAATLAPVVDAFLAAP
jgi:pimeloyl-ACP methyl ester carboxylesterase